MPLIYQMPPQLSNLIAAGEVVERPGSVVKELVENAIDAGAKQITVEIKNGGVSYLRVTDDGGGILPEDVRTAFLRHATSKIRRESDLYTIGTLGFRGEALAAIASVARVDLFTRTKHYDAGVQITMEGGEETGYGDTGCPVGTTIVVRDLFFNVPARAKFLKKDATEGAYVESALTQIAVSRPQIAFRLIKDGRESFSTPGDGRMLSAVYACYGKELASGLMALTGSYGEITVEGYVSPPELTRASRAQQSFYINGRYIRSRLLSAAVEEAYKGRMMVGRYPVCFLNLRMSPAAVDVNVHPAKLEVKFSREKETFSAVYHSVVSVLEASGELKELKSRHSLLTPKEDTLSTQQQTIENVQKKPIYVFPESYGGAGAPLASGQKLNYQTKQTERAENPPSPASQNGIKPLSATSAAVRIAYETAGAQKPEKSVNLAENINESLLEPDAVKQNSLPHETLAEEPDSLRKDARQEPLRKEANRSLVRVLGEVFHTYIVAEDDDGIWLIDKHAAHEKLLFDQLKAQLGQQPAQLLLSPLPVTLSQVEKAACLDRQELLREAGFSIEDFGTGALLVREAPMYLDEQDISFVLSDMAEKILSFRGSGNELLDSLLKSVACKAAVKAGMDTDEAELQAFAAAVLENDSVRNCPHGRPCVTFITRYQLEKLFKRVQ